MIELPRRIRVLNRTYIVKAMTTEDGEHIGDGVCNPRREIIKISLDQSNNNILETLFHEVAHAVNSAASLGDSSSEEDYVTRTTPIWMAVWRDNPELFQLLVNYVEC